MTEVITLENVLPRVFAGMEGDEPLRSSEVWLGNITFGKPGFYLIEAESGTGKSSLCSFIYGSRGDYSGVIRFGGRDIRTFSDREWCRLRCRSLAYLPQEMRLFPELTVMENIMIKNRLTGYRSIQWIRDALERMEIGVKADSPAALLSVGQQQRAAIVRAMCQPFDFLLIDEPVSHLDARNNGIAAGFIADEARAQGAAVIATSVGNKIQLPFITTLHL
ncbi:MAG: ATP-binding cassette domain-containing protein [Muribaculaceae bacterium]|nr:ATP-binding cassette domain-containing protein [Muribaculaceae bacterium]